MLALQRSSSLANKFKTLNEGSIPGPDGRLPLLEDVEYDEEEPPHPRHISAMCLSERMSRVRNKHKPLCSVEKVKLKVALPRTRPHMCNGNVAPKRTRNPTNPHEWEQKWTSSLASRYVATLTDGSIKPKNNIFNRLSKDQWNNKSTPEVQRFLFVVWNALFFLTLLHGNAVEVGEEGVNVLRRKTFAVHIDVRFQRGSWYHRCYPTATV